jgi:hypothetical protein
MEMRLRITPHATSGMGVATDGVREFVSTLRATLPLARMCVHVNDLDGVEEATIVLPNRTEEADFARTLAMEYPLARTLELLLKTSLLVLAGTCVLTICGSS